MSLETFGFGPGDNPIFPGMHEATARIVGGTLAAARAVMTGKRAMSSTRPAVFTMPCATAPLAFAFITTLPLPSRTSFKHMKRASSMSILTPIMAMASSGRSMMSRM